MDALGNPIEPNQLNLQPGEQPQIPVIGRPRQYEMLAPDMMQQFSSKEDIYEYLSSHLQVSAEDLDSYLSAVLLAALRDDDQGLHQGHLRREEEPDEAQRGQDGLRQEVRRDLRQGPLRQARGPPQYGPVLPRQVQQGPAMRPRLPVQHRPERPPGRDQGAPGLRPQAQARHRRGEAGAGGRPGYTRVAAGAQVDALLLQGKYSLVTQISV
jgi:hypothetical protein